MPQAARPGLRQAAWGIVEAAERMRLHWAESSPDVRNSDLWRPLHEAADGLREALEATGGRL